jgi:hypothetical protein
MAEVERVPVQRKDQGTCTRRPNRPNSFIDSHMTIVSAAKHADNGQSNIITAVTGGL